MSSADCLKQLEELCELWGVELSAGGVEMYGGVDGARREMRLNRGRWLLEHGDESDADGMSEGCQLFEGLCRDREVVSREENLLGERCAMLGRVGAVDACVSSVLDLVRRGLYAADMMVAGVVQNVGRSDVVGALLSAGEVSAASWDVETAVMWAWAACDNRREGVCPAALGALLGRGGAVAGRGGGGAGRRGELCERG